MKDEKLKNETEILSAEDEKLRAMCRSLKRIDAPQDFEFQVKARIARATPKDFVEPRFGFAFRYALPALALILVLGLLAFNGGFWSSENSPAIAEGSSAQPNPALPQNAVVSSLTDPADNEQPKNNSAVLPSNQDLPKISDKEVAESTPKNSEPEKKRELQHDNFKGSADKSKRNAEVLQPKGFRQDNVPQNFQNNQKSNPIPVKDVLSIIGINADLENGKWTVKTVAANSMAERSDVKQNDVIEAIGEQTLSAESSFNTSNVKTITVSRGGGKIVIKLQNK